MAGNSRCGVYPREVREVSTEEILSRLDERFSCPAGPVRYIASGPLAPPPADPSPRAPKYQQRKLAIGSQAKATRAAKVSRQRIKRECPHPRWCRVRKSETAISCRRCRIVREVTAQEREQMCPQVREGGQPREIVHGTRGGYFRGCRCELCRKKESDHRKEVYRAKHPLVVRPPKPVIDPKDCPHETWWRQRIGDGITASIQCRKCKVSRVCPSELVADLCSGRKVEPHEIPPARPNAGRPLRPRQHGTHAMYRAEKCRCDVCLNFYNRYKREQYRRLRADR